mgnify:CR=1 FL=1
MKRLCFYSFTILALTSIYSAQAESFVLTPQEIDALNASAAEPPVTPPTNSCDSYKPTEKSGAVPFNASPCFGQPRKINPNPGTREAAKYACGKHAGQWQTYCTCLGKKLKTQPDFLGDIFFVNCSKDPNSQVDCGSFSCD